MTVTKSNMEDADISSVTLKFKVTKAWIDENNIDADTIAMQRYSNGAWTKLATSKVSEDGTYIYFEAISPGLSVYAISAEKKVTTTTTTVPTTTTTLPVVLPGVPTEWVIAIIVVIAIVAFLLWKFRILKLGSF